MLHCRKGFHVGDNDGTFVSCGKIRCCFFYLYGRASRLSDAVFSRVFLETVRGYSHIEEVGGDMLRPDADVGSEQGAGRFSSRRARMSTGQAALKKGYRNDARIGVF